MNRLAWFKFDPAMFVQEAKNLSTEEVGLYIAMLSDAWLNAETVNVGIENREQLTVPFIENKPEVFQRLSDTKTKENAEEQAREWERFNDTVLPQVLAYFKLETLSIRGVATEVYVSSSLTASFWNGVDRGERGQKAASVRWGS